MNLVFSLLMISYFDIKNGNSPNGIQIFTFLLEQINDLFDVKDMQISKEIWPMVI